MIATGIKNIVITATTRYPIVSAYEYEFLKGEEEIQRRMSGCTIYFILQRPLMYFNNVREVGRTIKFDIVDTVHKPLHATLDLDLFVKGGACEVEYQFYKTAPDKASPRNDVAAFKIRDGDGKSLSGRRRRSSSMKRSPRASRCVSQAATSLTS